MVSVEGEEEFEGVGFCFHTELGGREDTGGDVGEGWGGGGEGGVGGGGGGGGLAGLL